MMGHTNTLRVRELDPKTTEIEKYRAIYIMYLTNKSRRRICNAVSELGYDDKDKAIIKRIIYTDRFKRTYKLGRLDVTSVNDDYQVQNMVHVFEEIYS